MATRRREAAPPKAPRKAAKAPAQAPDPVRALARAFLTLRNEDEVRRFLADICTPAETRALAERWHVAGLLADGDLSYRDICQETGVSTATIVRVARFLKEEQFGGYRLVLARQGKGLK